MQGNVSRLEKHLESCSERPAKRSCDEMTTESDAMNSAKRRNQKPLDKHVVVTTADNKDSINMQLTRAILATNTPFSFVDNPQFKKFYQMLRPGLQLAGRHDVAGDLLNRVYSEELTEAQAFFKGAYKKLN